MTETQIQTLWDLAPEGNRIPILCFDGDNAGRRAAERAIVRVLPLLRPDHSVRVAFLPQSQDPDSLIRTEGVQALQRVLDGAHSLLDALWQMEMHGRDLNQPDGRAGLEAAIKAHIAVIPSPEVRRAYEQDLRDRMYALGRAGSRQKFHYNKSGRDKPGIAVPILSPTDRIPMGGEQRREQALLAILVHHPALLDEVSEALAEMTFTVSAFDAVRRDLLGIMNTHSVLDAEALHRHLSERGHGAFLDGVRRAGLSKFIQADATIETARAGWQETYGAAGHLSLQAELRQAEHDLAHEFTPERLARLQALKQEFRARRGVVDDDEPGPE